jgi:hypothetical protein
MYLTGENAMRAFMALAAITLVVGCDATTGGGSPGPGKSVSDAVGKTRESVSQAVGNVGYDADAARNSAALCARARIVGNYATGGFAGSWAQNICQVATGVVAGSGDSNDDETPDSQQ